MKRFEDLEFVEHGISKSAREAMDKTGIDLSYQIGHKQAIIDFDNGSSMSVLFGDMFYSDGVNTYEAWCKELDDEPRGYLTKDEVTAYMMEAQ